MIIVDEISTPQEVQAARTIAQRGVMLIATVHGITLPELVQCKERGILTGGTTSVTLSGQEAERRFDKRKQVQKRAQEPVFSAALELHSRNRWVYHSSIKEAADAYFEGDPCNAEELRPGRSISIAAIPGEGLFEYCYECGLGPTCNVHSGGHNEVENGRPYSTASSPQMFGGNSMTNQAQKIQSPPNRPFALNSAHQNGPSFQNNINNGAKKRRSNRRRAPRGSGNCRVCGLVGHYARDCPNRHR